MEKTSLFRLYDIKLPFDHEHTLLQHKVAQISGLTVNEIDKITLVKRSLDARSHGKPTFVYCLDVMLKKDVAIDEKFKRPPQRQKQQVVCGKETLHHRPTIIGCGPAGLFAALWLAKQGYHPLVIEQGQSIPDRRHTIARFLQSRQLDCNSNYVFGEGGAGAYSDGKLNTGVSRGPIRDILEIMVEHGAPPEISYISPPHIGSDRLRAVIIKMRSTIIANGGEFLFSHKVTDLQTKNRQIMALNVGDKVFNVGVVILATGSHDARTFTMLEHNNVEMHSKPFQIGVRIEHPQQVIDRSLLGKYAGQPLLSPAAYRLRSQKHTTYKQVCSFCMCPGGTIIPATDSNEHLVTNGMSNYKQDSCFANSALVTTIYPQDLKDNSPLAGLTYRRNIEKQAFLAGGANFSCPAQRATDFLKNQRSHGSLQSSYQLGCRTAEISDILPPAVTNALAWALPQFDRKIRGFIKDGLLLAPETRASCPIRITRDKEKLYSPLYDNLYPSGEGAGYAGGIISAALDGIKVANAIISRYAPFSP